MKFKILAPFQKNNNFYKANVIDMQWEYTPYSYVDDMNKFHYFKFIEIDTSWSFDDQPSYIFPIFYEARETSFTPKTNKNLIINFINENIELFEQRKLIPVFLDPLEGNHGFGPALDMFAETFPNITFYFINGDYRLKNRKNKFVFKFNDQWIHHIPPQNKKLTYTPNKLYINFNRVARYHRCMLMDALINKNLFSKGYNTWANAYGAYDEYENDYPNSKIKEQTYNILDVSNITEANPTNKIPIDFCEQSMFYIVTETHYDNEVLFLSEKTYKPISIGMPFMSLGNPGTLNYLKELGFKTFDKWIDESYDDDLPLVNRIQLLVNELKRISKLPLGDKVRIRKEMEEVCEHNLSRYQNLQKNNTLIKIFKDIEEQQ